MKTVLTAIVGIALGALLFTVPMAGATGGDGTGPDGKGCPKMQNGDQGNGQMMQGKDMGCGCCCGKMKNGEGMGFVDADGDGVCDHYAKGMANNSGKCKGQGAGFVDVDGNGICDHHPDNAKSPQE